MNNDLSPSMFDGESMNFLPPPEPSTSNQPRFYYTALLKNFGDVIHGKLKKTYGSHMDKPDNSVNKPLGAAYDEVMEHWIVADSGNDCLRFYTENSIVGDSAFGNLKNPSAVAVCVPGESVAVLDETSIRLYDYRNENFFTAVTNEKEKWDCRGLGCTSQGDLVTIQRTWNGGKLAFFSSKEANIPLRDFPYFAPAAPYGVKTRGPNPCFLDVAGDRIVVTDLGVNSFTIFDFDAKQLNIRLLAQQEAYGTQMGQFQFISGAKFDAKGDLLIADASLNRLYFFDNNGNFVGPVQFSDNFAYASGIAVNSHNELMVCDRRHSECKVYTLSGQPPYRDLNGGNQQHHHSNGGNYHKHNHNSGRSRGTAGRPYR